ncbi:iron-containing redox enzyme family protein [Magnetovibrio sp.]|uniref:TenA family transcriptional regulator n=1 Tax=Magnetovibrio sp. TaxID=2024836 RepID=UPI002F9268D9
MTFFDRLVTETQSEREDFRSISVIQTAISQGVTKELYAKYLTQAYHHVRFTVPLLECALEDCGVGDEAYANALAEYIAEESGHDEWILDDIKALGADSEAVRNGRGGFACRVMISHAYYLVEKESPYALLGMVHVLEGMSVELAERAAGAIRAGFGDTPPNAFSYLTSHGALDMEHVRFFEDLVNGLNDTEIENTIIAAAKDFYKLFGNMFRELGEELLAPAANQGASA